MKQVFINSFLLFCLFTYNNLKAQDTLHFKNIYFDRSLVLDDGNIIAGNSKKIYFIDVKDKKVKTLFKIINENYSSYQIKRHPTKKIIFVKTKGRIEVFDYENNKKLNPVNIDLKGTFEVPFEVHQVNGECVLWVVHKGKIIIYNYDKNMIEITLNDQDESKVFNLLKQDNLIVTFSATSLYGPDKITLWDADNRKIIKEGFMGSFVDYRYISSKGNFMIFNARDHKVVQFWKTESIKFIRDFEIENKKDKEWSPYFTNFIFSPNEKFLITIENRGDARIEYDIENILKDKYDRKYVNIKKLPQLYYNKIEMHYKLKKEYLFHSNNTIIISNIDKKYLD